MLELFINNFTFPTAGTWYNYFTGATVVATGAAQSFTLQPGDYNVYINRNLSPVIIPPPILIPTTFSTKLFPNPINNSTVLEINMPTAGNIIVDIFNMSGQNMGNLLSQSLGAGTQQFPLTNKISNLPSGMYLLKVIRGNSVQSLKMIIP